MAHEGPDGHGASSDRRGRRWLWFAGLGVVVALAIVVAVSQRDDARTEPVTTAGSPGEG